MTTAEQLMQQGREQVLLAQLEQRFGPLSEATIDRVRASKPEQLDRMASAILTAATLDEVLAD